jgi:beta-1,4-mannosyl-glycoprotein beta-1,4-N-acetylglucosaminyltransferase
MKTFDCFLFFNELDLLEIRFNILNDIVDYFVIVEASQTFQGEQKEFIFEKNKKRFAKYEHKIVHFT